jgi:UDP-N-acetylmuramyl pentapeptide phosphotransferase/UDP-N-acetylglucosamine-1-phosphate transferase
LTAFVVLAAAGLAAGLLLRTLLQPLFELPALARENYRGQSVATAGGVTILVAALVVEGAAAFARSLRVGHGLTTPRALVLVLALGFGALGLVDDLVGSGHARGFRGHLGELRRAHLTTGGLKLLGGAAAALAVAGVVDGHAPGRLLADAALVALAANLANQLDRRPGRMLKVAIVSFAVLVVCTRAWRALEGVALVSGAGAALLLDDLRERAMLGDVGANALGACLGAGVMLACTFSTRLVVLVVVAGLNIVGELSSFTRLIEAVPPLRAIDRAGRREP